LAGGVFILLLQSRGMGQDNNGTEALEFHEGKMAQIAMKRLHDKICSKS